MYVNSIAKALASLDNSLTHLLPYSLLILINDDGSIVEISENSNFSYSPFVSIISKEKYIQSIFEISVKDLLFVSNSLSTAYPIRKTIDKGMVYWDDLETDLPLAGLRLIRIGDNSILGIFQITELLPAMQYFGMGAFFLLDSNECFRAYSTGILSEKAEQTGAALIGKNFGDYFTPSIYAIETEAFKAINDKESYTKLYSQSELTISSTNDFSILPFPLPNHTETDFVWTVKGKILSGEAPQLLFGRINKSIDNVGSGCFQMGKSSDGYMFKRNGMKIRWRKEEKSLHAPTLFDYKWIKQGKLHQFFVDGKIVLQAIGDFPSQLYAEAFQILLRPRSQVVIDVFEIDICGSKNSDNSRTFGIVREKSEPFRTFQLARFVNPAL
ncbi:MAG: hypothetical protein JNL74_01955, partial [Fibrobacteres bacterium]|nr:hypothetical protein [Fibrobacterota bacterium]